MERTDGRKLHFCIYTCSAVSLEFSEMMKPADRCSIVVQALLSSVRYRLSWCELEMYA